MGGRERIKSSGAKALERVRHARHPLHGWRKWALILFQALVGLVVLFAVVNLTLA